MTLGAGVSAFIAVALWAAFGVMVWQLGEVRAKVATRAADLVVRDERDQSSAQLQTLMRDTKESRAELSNLLKTDALAAAATIEAAGKRAGVPVSIGGAVASEIKGTASSDLREVVFVANAEGEFVNLMKVAELFETLPFPSHVESYEFFSLDASKGQRDPWRMSARIRGIIPDTQ